MPPTASLLDAARARLIAGGRHALKRIRQAEARAKQKRFVGHYIAVTGSCGKSTTTVLTAGMLAAYGPTVSDRKNNDGISLFRTVRKLTGPVDYVVQETSGHEPGAIAWTTEAYRVDVAVVTAVGLDHATAFRSPDLSVPDAIAREKGKLVEAVAPGGFAVLNFDDPRVRAMASRTGERVVGFGRAADAALRAENIEAKWPSRLRFDLVVGGQRLPVVTRFVGTMMLSNILGALSVVHGFGLDLGPAIAALAQLEPVPDRMGVHTGADGKTYILDTEKAPYWSTELLVDDLPAIGIPGLTFVLGEMSDIRGNSRQDYRKLIRALAPRVETLVLAGRAAELGAAPQADGVSNIVIAPAAIDVAKYLDTRPPGVVLLKSNGSLQLHRVLDQVTPGRDPINV